MKYPWREEGRRSIYEGSRFITVFDRTKLKPRPEGYRDFYRGWVPVWGSPEWAAGTVDSIHDQGILRFDSQTYWYDGVVPEPVEALEPSQTGEVPPEPSKGLHGASGGVETASLNQP